MIILHIRTLRFKVIANDPLQIAELKKYFSKEEVFSIKDINRFYENQLWFLAENTLRWRTYRLSKMKVLQRVGRGLYKLGEEVIYIPKINLTNKRIYNKIHRQFPYAAICIWHTSSLNEFMIHQPGRFNLMLEIEKDAAESVFYFLKESYRNIYLDPGEEVFYNYIAAKRESIIVNNLVSEAPTQEIYGVQTATLEKILVDIFCNDIIFSAYQGQEMNNIFTNALNSYTVNINKLLRYAQRRGRKKDIETYIKRISNYWQ